MKKRAREFAIQSHGNQKYGEHPYSVHLDAVAKISRSYGETAEIISYLHDVVEDTDVKIEEIESIFGSLIATSVAILTDEPGKDRKERKSKTYAKMANVSGDAEVALIVKAADRLANMRACIVDNNQSLLEVYKTEYPIFKKSAFRDDA